MKKAKIGFVTFLVVSFAFTSGDNELIGLVGQPLGSESAKSFIAKSGVHTEEKFDDCYFYVFQKKGFDLRMSYGDTITTVFVFAAGADQHKKYSGELPYELKITHNRKAVEKILGTPDVTGGDGVIPYYCAWEEKGLAITYQSLDTTDMRNKIHHISFSGKPNK
ncbi:MAG TPA: hypothetical protein VK826_03160 [Bacteroidia bacterium]|nr:hypothetical protein [Bacteroidia bacterium]